MAVPDTIAWAKPEDVGMSRERLARIGEVLAADIEKGRLPGAVSVVARRGRIVHFKAAGFRDPATRTAMERDAIFRVYSMTKPIVSVAAMMLAEEGRLLLSDPLSAFIPAFADTPVAAIRPDGNSFDLVPQVRSITIQDLLRHTAGLTYDWLCDGPIQRLYVEKGAGRRDRSAAENAALLATLPLVAQPGSAWHYSRATDVIGRVVEIVSGQTLGRFLEERIFGPLGMLETGFHVPDALHGRIAEAFATDPDSGEAVRLIEVRQPPAFENGGGGLVSTAPDYARFLHMLASGGGLDGARLLSPRTVAFMAADHLGPKVRIETDILADGHGFGLGFAVRRAAGVAPYPGSPGDLHWMGLGGTSFWLDPAEDLYAVLMIQAPGQREHYRRLFRSLVYAALVD